MNVVDHGSIDFVRDVLVAVVAGLLIPVIVGYFAHRRITKKRLERIAVEVRHTQKNAKQRADHEPDIEPFYDGDL